MTTLDEHVETVKRMAAQLGGTLEPDGDWAPTLIGMGVEKDGEPLMVLATLAGLEKGVWTQYAREVVRQGRVKVIAAVLSAWAFRGKDAKETAEAMAWAATHGGVKAHPKRVEILMIEASDGRRAVSWEAPILREPGKSPALGPWQEETSEERYGALAGFLLQAFEVPGQPVQ